MTVSRAQIIGRLREKQAKDLLRRGFKVQARARLLLGGAGPAHPKRVDTGQLRSSIQVRLLEHGGSGGSPLVRIGTGLKHARFVHDGTGVYGPRHRPITPKTAKVLVFPSGTYGAKRGKFKGLVVVRSVKGMRRNRFLKDALVAARD